MMVPYHRRGIAGADEYTAVITPDADGCRWYGHKRVTGGAGQASEGFGDVVASGGPYKVATEAAAAADRWFEGIPGISEERRPGAHG